MMGHEKIHSMDRITTGLPEGITERFVLSVGETKREQVISAYAPSSARHPEYPAGLPFIPDTVAFVTIHPDGAVPPGARWQPSSNAGAAFDSIVQQSKANGWDDAPANDPIVDAITKVMPARPDVKTKYLRKGNVLRTIIAVGVEGQIMLQLLDAPDPV
jgi:hypothetical protein